MDKKHENNISLLTEGVRDGIAICLGYLAVSFAFGIQAGKAGLSVFQAALMSLTNVTSAGQFSALDLIERGAPLLELALLQLVVNLRYLLMSTALTQKFSPSASTLYRLGTAYGVTDEIFGVSITRKGDLRPPYSFGIISISVLGWVSGTVLGASAGNILPARIVAALGLAIYGMFLAIILPEARTSKPMLIVVLSAMAMSALFTWLPLLSRISSGFRIIIVTLVIAGIAAVLFPVSDESGMEEGS